MKMYSKKLESGGVLTHAAILEKVFDSHRKSHHYSIRKTKPELYVNIENHISRLSINIIKEALDIYENSLNKTDNKRPHPNYFLAVCRRLSEDSKGKIIRPKIIWGKEL